MIRYESKGVQPPADILNKLSDVFNTSVDYLINGNSDEKAIASLKKSEVLQRFKEVETLPEREQSVLLEIIGAYIRDFKTKQAYILYHKRAPLLELFYGLVRNLQRNCTISH